MVLQRQQLKPKILRNLGLIQAGVSRGLNSQQVNSLIFQNEGSGARRVDLLAGIRYVRGIEESGLQLRNIRRDLKPDLSRLQVAKTKIISEFSYQVEIRESGHTAATPRNAFLTIRSSSNLSRKEIEEEAINAIEVAENEGQNYLQITADEILLVGALRR